MKAIIRLHYVQGWDKPEPFWTVEVNRQVIEQDFDSESAAIAAAFAAGAKKIIITGGGRPR